MYPSAFISPVPHSPILLAVLPLSSSIPSLPSCLLVPPVQPLFPHSPPLWQSARPSSCTPHSFCWPVLSLHLSPPFLPSPPHEHLLSCLHFQQKHLCACSVLPDLRPRLTYTWKKQELSLQGWSHWAAHVWAGATHACSAGTSLGAVRAWAQGWVTSGLLSTRGWGVLMDGGEKSSENGIARNRDESAMNTQRCLQALSP